MRERRTFSFSQSWSRGLDRLGGHYVSWYKGYLRKRQSKLQNELGYVNQELAKLPVD